MGTDKIEIGEELKNKQMQFVNWFMISTSIIHLFFGVLFYYIDLHIVMYLNITVIVFTVF